MTRLIHFHRWVLVLVAVCSLFVISASAQNLTGTINGVVEDSSGAVIPGAEVIITNVGTGVIERSLKADSGGRYEAPALLAGTYQITVRSQGFETVVINSVVLSVDQTRLEDVNLKVGSVNTEVSVSASVVSLDLQDAAQSTTIAQREVTELPTNQHNFVQFIALQPGVQGGTGTMTRGPLGVAGGNNTMSISVNGGGANSNGYFLDGADFINHDGNNILAMYPSTDALEEINLLRNNFGAQYGGGGSAIFNMVTKSGTSSFHGSAYYYMRNQLLNANGYFNNQTTPKNPRVPFRYNDFGFTTGGPLFIPRLLPMAKSNTFFFVSGAWLRSAQPATSSVANVPTANQLQGIFDSPVCVAYNAGGTCTSTSTTVTNINPLSKLLLDNILKKLPLPNTTDGKGLYSSFNGIMNEGQILARVDRSFGNKAKGFARFVNDPYNSLGPEGIGGNTNPIPGLADTAAISGAQNLVFHATYMPTLSWVLEGGISDFRGYENTDVVGLLNPKNVPGFNPAMPFPNLTGKLPTFTISGTKYNSAGPIIRINPTRQAFINVTHVMGRNTILFGANGEKMKSWYTNKNNGNNGGFNFTAPASVGNADAVWRQSLANFLEGYVVSFTQSTSQPGQGASVHLAEGYVQDNFKATRKLTLNFGLRYSYYRKPTEWTVASNFGPNLYDASRAPTMITGTGSTSGYMCLASPCAGGVVPNSKYDVLNGMIVPGVNSPYGRKMTSQPKTNLAPRFGFAWSPFSDDKTSIRGGFGIYYILPGIWDQLPSQSNPPATQQVSANNVPFANPGGAVAPATTPPAIQAYDVNARTAYIESYDLNVQRLLPAGLLLDVAYSGNGSRHHEGTVDLNQPVPGAYVTAGIAAAGGLTSSNSIRLNSLRPYRGYGAFSAALPIFTTNYNALLVQFKEHIGSSLDVGGAYTWAKTLGISGAQNIYNPQADYGPSQKQNQFVGHAVYLLPFYRAQKGIIGHLLGGYEVSGIARFQAGGRGTASIGNVDPAGLGLLTAGTGASNRPDQVANPNNGPRTIAQWFNTSAFTAVPKSVVRPGNGPVGSIVMPGSAVVDFTAMRNIRVAENVNLQLRAEAYNVFNHTNWSGPNTTQSNTNFGKITNNGDARNMQIAAKLRF